MDSFFSKTVAVRMKTYEKQSENVEGEQQKPPPFETNETVEREESSGTGNIQKISNKRSAEENAITIEPSSKKLNKTGEPETSRTQTHKNKEPCVFDSLPIEVLELILSHISSLENRKQIRRVCKLWYEVSNCQNQREVFIRDFRKIRMQSATYKHLLNCGFEYLNLSIGAYELKKLPVTLWEEIGMKIRLLEFINCLLGDKILESVVLFCPNLRILRICLKFPPTLYANKSICSIEALEKLNVVRSQLETFDISVDRSTSFGKQFPLIQSVDYETWRRIFEALFRIFPNIVQFSWTKYCQRRTLFKCAFTRESGEVSDNLEFASVFAHSLSANNWTTAFNILATLRLTSISLDISDDLCNTPVDAISILEFFEDSRKLKSVQLKLPEFPYRDIFKSVLFRILDNCGELRKLEYFKNSSILHILDLNENERTRLIESLSKLEEVSMSNFLFRPTSLSLSSSGWTYNDNEDDSSLSPWTYNDEDFRFELTSKFWFQYFTNLQHLTIVGYSNNILQKIFEFLVHLRTLNVDLSTDVTNFGITGRSSRITGHVNGKPDPVGYSINRLQNLEKLTIRFDGFREGFDETIYLDFNFPNLQFLHCYGPSEISLFALIGVLMPLLKTIHFGGYMYPYKEDMAAECLIALGQSSGNLHSLCLECNIAEVDARKIFDVCPTLRFLHFGYIETFYYDHLTRKVILSHK